MRRRFLSSCALAADLAEYAAKKRTGITLQHLLEFGRSPTLETRLTSAAFLAHELPIRIAHRAQELGDLPLGLSEMPSIQLVKHWYEESFRELLAAPPAVDEASGRAFVEALHKIKTRHGATLITVAKGVHELKQHLVAQQAGGGAKDAYRVNVGDLPEIQATLNAFYMSRMGIRMLIGQHIALHEETREGWVGVICENTSPYEVAVEAIDQARYMCTREFGDAPEVEVHGQLGQTFPFLPSHLHHILFELLKNSTRAVCEHHGEGLLESGELLPPVRVVIAGGEANEDVAIMVSDEGGGIPRSALHKIWHYTYTTAGTGAFERLLDGAADYGGDAPLAGLGYGLPISRQYARFFGGDLSIISMEGYGTDAYLHLKRVSNVREPLP